MHFEFETQTSLKKNNLLTSLHTKMKNLQEKLAKVQVTELETRKEFTFYCAPKCHNPCHNHCDDGGGPVIVD